jgi:hypothetical protein
MELSYRFWRNAQVAIALILAGTIAWRVYAGSEGINLSSTLLIVLIGVSYAAGKARKREQEQDD